MSKPKQYSAEVRERAVRLVHEHETEHVRNTPRPFGESRSIGACSTCPFATPSACAEAGIEPSVGSRGDSYDKPWPESVIGLFKTEVIWLRKLRTIATVAP